MPYVQPPTILVTFKKTQSCERVLASILKLKIRASERSVTEWSERF